MIQAACDHVSNLTGVIVFQDDVVSKCDLGRSLQHDLGLLSSLQHRSVKAWRDSLSRLCSRMDKITQGTQEKSLKSNLTAKHWHR